MPPCDARRAQGRPTCGRTGGGGVSAVSSVAFGAVRSKSCQSLRSRTLIVPHGEPQASTSRCGRCAPDGRTSRRAVRRKHRAGAGVGEVRSPRVPKRSLQARETAPTRPQYGEPSVQADRVGSFGLPRRRGSKKTRGCKGHKRGACGHAPHARHARATTPARVCGGGRQGWRRSNCRAPYLPSELIAHAHRAFWLRHGVL
jgi:hypothetical protein